MGLLSGHPAKQLHIPSHGQQGEQSPCCTLTGLQLRDNRLSSSCDPHEVLALAVRTGFSFLPPANAAYPTAQPPACDAARRHLNIKPLFTAERSTSFTCCPVSWSHCWDERENIICHFSSLSLISSEMLHNHTERVASSETNQMRSSSSLTHSLQQNYGHTHSTSDLPGSGKHTSLSCRKWFQCKMLHFCITPSSLRASWWCLIWAIRTENHPCETKQELIVTAGRRQRISVFPDLTNQGETAAMIADYNSLIKEMCMQQLGLLEKLQWALLCKFPTS